VVNSRGVASFIGLGSNQPSGRGGETAGDRS
jgi:hypothetical protein